MHVSLLGSYHKYLICVSLNYIPYIDLLLKYEIIVTRDIFLL